MTVLKQVSNSEIVLLGIFALSDKAFHRIIGGPGTRCLLFLSMGRVCNYSYPKVGKFTQTNDTYTRKQS